MRTVVGVGLLCVAVAGLGGPLFYGISSLSGADMRIDGGLIRLVTEVAVGSYALFWSYRLRTGTWRTVPAVPAR